MYCLFLNSRILKHLLLLLNWLWWSNRIEEGVAECFLNLNSFARV